MVLTRRCLLAGSLATLAGCALVDPSKDPTPLPSPSRTPSPSLDAVVEVHAAAGAALLGEWGATQGQLDVLGWMVSVCAEQAEALDIALPADDPAPYLGDDPLPALRELLGSARSRYVASATDPTAARPLLWASMAAWTTGAKTALGLDEPLPGFARGRMDPAPGTPEETLTSAVSAAFETAYGLEVVAGTPGVSDRDIKALSSAAMKWRHWGIDTASAADLPAVPEPFYLIERPESAEAAISAAAEMITALTLHLGRAIAHAEVPQIPTLVDALNTASGQVPRWGGRADRWPGIP